MPSFVCDACQDTIKKPKLDHHAYACRSPPGPPAHCVGSAR